MCHITFFRKSLFNKSPYSIWLIFFQFFLCSPALAMISQRYLAFLYLAFLTQLSVSIMWLGGISCQSVWGMIFQWGSTLKVSIELHVTSRHYRDMTERLLKVMLSPNQTNNQLCCKLNKEIKSDDDDWLKYPIVLFDAVLQSLSSFLVFLRPCFCNLGKPRWGMVTCDSVPLTLI